MTIELLSDLLLASTNTVILTGAGMSTESGVPDFRSASGWWRNIDPRTVASVEALENHYELFREFYQMRVKALADCQPHVGHKILADWERRGLVGLVATQNVDRFHQQAGSVKVEELHGNIQTVRCKQCGQPGQLDDFFANTSCTHCSGQLRPNVVLFGEALPDRAWTTSLLAIEQADLVIVIGTSLEVYPVNQLPRMTRGKLVYINLDVEQHASSFDVVIKGKAGEVLTEVNRLLD